MLDEYTGPIDIDMFFRAFLAASLVNVQIWREIGISPLGPFDIYVKIEFLAFQKRLCSLLPALYKRVRRNFTSSYAKDDVDRDLFLISRPRYAAHALPEYAREAREIFSEVYQLFANNRYYRKSYVSHPKFDTPPEEELILFCFDEAGQLFNGQDPRDTRVKALQESLREFSVKRSSNSKKKFFGVFINRGAEISGFDPMQQHQHRKLTWAQPKLLHILHPICELDMVDIFAPNEEKTWNWIKTATEAVVSDREPNNLRNLYRLGRPLWAGLLGWQDLSEVISLADTKMLCGKKWDGNPLTTSEALAMLSYSCWKFLHPGLSMQHSSPRTELLGRGDGYAHFSTPTAGQRGVITTTLL